MGDRPGYFCQVLCFLFRIITLRMKWLSDAKSLGAFSGSAGHVTAHTMTVCKVRNLSLSLPELLGQGGCEEG